MTKEIALQALAARLGISDAESPELLDILAAQSLLTSVVLIGPNNARDHFLGADNPSKDKLADVMDSEARRAFARLLRSDRPLNRQLSLLLADLVDPDIDARAGVTRKLTFSKRTPGRHSSANTHLSCARIVLDGRRAGMTVQAAMERAARLYNLDFNTVEKIWKKHRRELQSGNLPRRQGVRK